MHFGKNKTKTEQSEKMTKNQEHDFVREYFSKR
jgi:hypothetical protein